MENILHYIWEHKIFPLSEMKTTDGRVLEVISPGMHNSDSGPDFFNAKIRLGGVEWVGNVEIHTKSSDWFLHHHHMDAAYDNVILHVVGSAEPCNAVAQRKNLPPAEFVLPVPEYVLDNFDSLLRSDTLPRCSEIIGSEHISPLMIHSWLSVLQVERLAQKTLQIQQRLARLSSNWEDTLFVTLARSFGFGINSEAFERWAMSFQPSRTVAKHRDSLLSTEAFFFGQAGLLEDDAIQHVYRDNAAMDTYLHQLRMEYRFLRNKFSLTPVPHTLWRLMRSRPQNFPHIRLAQLAMLYHEQKVSLSSLLNAAEQQKIGSREQVAGSKAFYDLLDTHVSPYWKTHYTFASTESEEIEKSLSNASKDIIIINAFVPMLFAYGRGRGDEALCERATEILEHIKPEDNAFVRRWQEAGVKCESAADSQAIVQLTKEYCNARKCLQCRFGGEYISRKPDFLCEETEK